MALADKKWFHVKHLFVFKDFYRLFHVKPEQSSRVSETEAALNSGLCLMDGMLVIWPVTLAPTPFRQRTFGNDLYFGTA
jgi:hypothetical protein